MKSEIFTFRKGLEQIQNIILHRKIAILFCFGAIFAIYLLTKVKSCIHNSVTILKTHILNKIAIKCFSS